MYEYDTDIDSSEQLDTEQVSYLQSLIGVMMWVVEIGRIEIATEVSMLSLFLVYPR